MTYEEWCAAPVECAFWDAHQRETLVHADIHDAVEDYVDGMGELPADEEATVRVTGYNPQSAAGFLDGSVLERALESLDEEFGDPNAGEYTQPTEAMRAAEAAFISAVLAEYHVWTCDKVVDVDVPILPWVREHRPDWLEDNLVDVTELHESLQAVAEKLPRRAP